MISCGMEDFRVDKPQGSRSILFNQSAVQSVSFNDKTLDTFQSIYFDDNMNDTIHNVSFDDYMIETIQNAHFDDG